VNEDAWYLILHNIFHNGHAPAPPDLRKPLRLHDTEDLELVRSTANIHAGEGVARALYFHRTGEVLDRSALRRLQTIQEDSTLEHGTAAESLLQDLRLQITNLSSLKPSLFILLLPPRSDPSVDFIAVYNATKETTESVCLLERLDREEKISDEAVPFTASQEILSTRSSMAINGKMLLGTLICFVIAWYSNPPNIFYT
jgi:hypothetical protein